MAKYVCVLSPRTCECDITWQKWFYRCITKDIRWRDYPGGFHVITSPYKERGRQEGQGQRDI